VQHNLKCLTHLHMLSLVAAQITHEDAEIPSSSAGEFEQANLRFRAWLRLAGVPLLPHRLSFYDQLPMKIRRKRTSKNPNLNVGAFGRLDIGIIVEAMHDELLVRGLDTQRVLYTDTDVLFADDLDYTTLQSQSLPTFAAGTEVFSPALNTGVMLVNASAWAAHYQRMIAYGQLKNFRFLSYDQTWVHEYFTRWAAREGLSRGWALLDDAVYNARGYMHPMRRGRGRQPVLPRLWHWHGFKPRDVDCWHGAIRSGRWPIRAWRNTVPGCTGKTRPRCMFMPVHNSGCRYFGRLTAVLGMTPCYLRTYTYLLEQHRRMLRIARTLEALVVESNTTAIRANGASSCDERGAAHVAKWEREWSEVQLRSAPPMPKSMEIVTTKKKSHAKRAGPKRRATPLREAYMEAK
jgi:hypothetical protein